MSYKGSYKPKLTNQKMVRILNEMNWGSPKLTRSTLQRLLDEHGARLIPPLED